MVQTENQSELDRLLAIILATIEYDILNQSNKLTPQEKSYKDDFYRVWKVHAEEQYNNKSLEKLRKSYDHITLNHKITGNLEYVQFIKDKTGYDFDLFGNLKERIDKIIARNRIANNKESRDVSAMVSLYRKNSVGQENAALLMNLKEKYEESKIKKKSDTTHNYLLEMNSPDNKRYVTMRESDSEFVRATYISLGFEDGFQTCLYSCEGINLGIKVYWKNNNTVVIQLPKENEILIQKFKSQYLTDIVDVVYPEN